jgi:mRNA interferase RelE/StbE
MGYTVLFQPAARRELEHLEKSNQRRIIAAVESLTENPHPPGCTKMSGFRDIWRIRIGVFRVIYQIRDQQWVVQIIRIAHRGDVYRGF